MKKIGTLFLVFIALFVFTSTVSANESKVEEETPPLPTIGTPAKDLINGDLDYFEINSNSNDIISTFSTSHRYLNNGSSSIRRASSNSLRMTGSTLAYSAVTTVGVQLTLQQWDTSNNRWVDVLTDRSITNSNTNSVSTFTNSTVTPNRYYRTKSSHWITHGVFFENATSYSEFILVN